MSYLKLFNNCSFYFPIHSFSDEKIEQSKYFVENLGKQVVEKVSNVNLSENGESLILEIFILASF